VCSVTVQQFQAPEDGLVGRNMLCSLVYWVSGVRIKKVAVKTEKYIEYSIYLLFEKIPEKRMSSHILTA
jgi:hypothetical protein